jgi:hypothetical protein
MMAADNGPRQRLGGVLASVAVALATVLLAAGPAAAAAVSIHDDSHVLDVTRVQNDAATLPDPVAVYTTTKFADDKAAFDRETQAKVTAPTVIVIATNTQSHHLAIRTGAKSRVTQQAAAAATQAFISTYRGSSDYTAATIAALDSMRNATGNSRTGQGAVAKPNAAQSSGGSFIGGLICLLLVVLVIVAAIVVIVRIARRRRQPQQAFGPPAGYDPAVGYGQPGYGPPPGYGPGYGQPGRSGVNPWVAGGVGVAAGGLLGYELGRMEGEHEERRHEVQSDQGSNDSGYGGGGADGDFGDSGGGGGDF